MTTSRYCGPAAPTSRSPGSPPSLPPVSVTAQRATAQTADHSPDSRPQPKSALPDPQNPATAKPDWRYPQGLFANRSQASAEILQQPARPVLSATWAPGRFAVEHCPQRTDLTFLYCPHDVGRPVLPRSPDEYC
jgi:hypothetical protein